MENHINNTNNYAIAYYGYSSAGQNEASIDQQREAAQEYAEKHDFEIIREYSDSAYSGTTDKMPGFQLMLAEIDKLKPAVLILWKLDCLFKNIIDYPQAELNIQKKGCIIHYVAENRVVDSFEDTLMGLIFEASEKQYEKELGKRIKAGKARNKKEKDS